jgi:hypothetical protein
VGHGGAAHKGVDRDLHHLLVEGSKTVHKPGLSLI